MSQTTVNLGYVLINRGEYVADPVTKYYKDNVVQYQGSAFIAAPVDYDEETNPLAYVTTAPYDTDPNNPNEGWKVFASDAAYVNSFMFFTENPEWVYVVCDKEDKILFGVKQDGEFYFGAGCPSQVKEYVEQRISEVSPENYEQVIAFLQDYLGSDTTLKMIIDALDAAKLDKEGLDADALAVQSITESPEYLQVTTDSEDKILEGIKSDGTKVIGADLNVGGNSVLNGDLQVLGSLDISGATNAETVNAETVNADNIATSVVENPEYIQVEVDSEDKILSARKTDGTKVENAGLEVKGTIDIDGATYSLCQSPEWIKVLVDSQERIIAGVRTDGSVYIGQLEGLDDKLQEMLSQMQAMLDEAKAEIDEKIAMFNTIFSVVDNPEFIQVTTDSEGKILQSRNPEGVNKEYVGIETPSLKINDVEIADNVDAIDTMSVINDPEGRSEIKTDSEGKILSYRDSEGVMHDNVGFETPIINTDVLNVSKVIVSTIKQSGIPEQTSEEIVYLEKPKFGEFRFYGELPTDTSDARTPKELDIVFKVDDQVKLSAKCTLALQGHGSLGEPKANFTIDFMNKNGEELAVKFGDMIAVDSYHLKSCWGDLTFARRTAGGALYREMMAALPYPYCKINNNPIDLVPSQKVDCYSIADAKYSEYGFPFVFYLNDEFHGVYCIKLKKTRQNYAMQKAVKTQIFLDVINNQTFLTQPFDYTHWDLKNPKLKNYEEGTEIKDTEVLASINRLFGFLNDIPGQQADYADYIVLPHWLTTIIFNEVIGNPDFIAGDDELSNNLELLTWDNTHWSLLPYDFDLSLGTGFADVYTEQTGILNNGTIPTQLTTLFETETKQIYTMLRNKGILTVENIVKHYEDFTASIPRELIDADYKKWGDKFVTAFNKTTGSYNQIYSYINSRITFLDTIWLNQN